MNIKFTSALRLKLQGDIAMATSNIDVFMANAVGVGEHGDVMTTIEEQFAVIAAARDKLKAINQEDKDNSWKILSLYWLDPTAYVEK